MPAIQPKRERKVNSEGFEMLQTIKVKNDSESAFLSLQKRLKVLQEIEKKEERKYEFDKQRILKYSQIRKKSQQERIFRNHVI